MKRVIKITLIIFISVILLKGIDVKAETSFPQSYSQNSYDYTIDKLRIECYKGASLLMQEQNKIKENEINIQSTDLAINPQLQEVKVKTASGNTTTVLSINLNLSMNKTFREYALSYMNAQSENEYMCVLKADYKIKKKEGYDYFYKFDHLLFQREDSDKDIKSIPEQDGYYPSSQVIDVMTFKNTTSSTTLGNLEGKEIALVNYSFLSKVDFKTATAADDENITMIYVHNLNNFEQLLEEEKDYNLVPNENNSTNNSNGNIEKTPVSKETKQIQKVTVPDTKASSSKIMLVSCIIMLLGGIILLCTIRKQKVPVKINRK